MCIIFDTQARRGGGGGGCRDTSRPRASRGTSKGRSFDMGVKTQRPRRGTHAEALRDREQSEINQRRRRVRKDRIIIVIRTKFLRRSGTHRGKFTKKWGFKYDSSGHIS